MSKETPKAGEWWWVEHRFTSRPVPAKWMEGGGWHCPSGWLAAEHAVPLSRIPDPPAPEPTEAEKIDARRMNALFDHTYVDPTQAEEVVRTIRASDEAAGYVTVPTSGPGFERMVNVLRVAMGGRSSLDSVFRAALEAAKGE